MQREDTREKDESKYATNEEVFHFCDEDQSLWNLKAV